MRPRRRDIIYKVGFTGGDSITVVVDEFSALSLPQAVSTGNDNVLVRLADNTEKRVTINLANVTHIIEEGTRTRF